MKNVRLSVLALASVFLASRSLPAGAASADAVVAYNPGSGYATEFGTGIGYTNPAVVLGQPNRDTAFGPVTPFNPPFSRNEIVSLGTNGSLVVRFDTPIQNDPMHAFGLDFIIYGSTGFIDSDFPNGRTDGSASVFGNNLGMTRVSVSSGDGIFYTLNPLFAPTVDTFYPTDGQGTFGLPVDPALTPADFANRTLAEIRSLYGGSAGGAGYDLSWAIDGSGQPVNLSTISFVRIDVLSGRAEIDGFAVVPEPSTWALGGLGLVMFWSLRRRRS
jgi:hypothetical protein